MLRRTTTIALLSVLAAISTTALPSLAADAAKPAPPGQSAAGPGGAEYKHADLVASQIGKGATACFIFEPAKPRPAQAPLIVFNHGYLAVDPVAYGRWIEHLVRRGNIVLYPVYQEGLTLSTALTPNAIKGVKDAIAELEKGDHVKPDLDKFAVVGHSAGGIITANMAATWKHEGLPQPRAVMAVQPGVSKLFPLADLKQIPADTLLLTLAGDKDGITGDADAKRIFSESTNVLAKNKALVTLRSDNHGWPTLEADHFAPIAVGGKGFDAKSISRLRLRAVWQSLKNGSAEKNGAAKGGIGADPKAPQGGDAANGEDKAAPAANGIDGLVALFTNTLDYYGTWKLFDGLTDAAFYGKNRQYALGNTPEQRFMGKWSDGAAVKELKVTDDPK